MSTKGETTNKDLDDYSCLCCAVTYHFQPIYSVVDHVNNEVKIYHDFLIVLHHPQDVQQVFI